MYDIHITSSTASILTTVQNLASLQKQRIALNWCKVRPWIDKDTTYEALKKVF